jgi:hypothetical protein
MERLPAGRQEANISFMAGLNSSFANASGLDGRS